MPRQYADYVIRAAVPVEGDGAEFPAIFDAERAARRVADRAGYAEVRRREWRPYAAEKREVAVVFRAQRHPVVGRVLGCQVWQPIEHVGRNRPQ